MSLVVRCVQVRTLPPVSSRICFSADGRGGSSEQLAAGNSSSLQRCHWLSVQQEPRGLAPVPYWEQGERPLKDWTMLQFQDSDSGAKSWFSKNNNYLIWAASKLNFWILLTVFCADVLSCPALGGLSAGLGSAQRPGGMAVPGPDPHQQGEDQQQLQLVLLHWEDRRIRVQLHPWRGGRGSGAEWLACHPASRCHGDHVGLRAVEAGVETIWGHLVAQWLAGGVEPVSCRLLLLLPNHQGCGDWEPGPAQVPQDPSDPPWDLGDRAGGVAAAGGAGAADLQGKRALLHLCRLRLWGQLWEGGSEPLAAPAGWKRQERGPRHQRNLPHYKKHTAPHKECPTHPVPQRAGGEGDQHLLIHVQFRTCSPPPPHLTCLLSPQVQAILEAWLHPTRSTSRTPLQTLSPSLSAWVAPGEEKASREELSSSFKGPTSSLFQCPLKPELWVLPGKTLSPGPGSGGQLSPAEEDDKWLLRKRSQAHVSVSIVWCRALFCFPCVCWPFPAPCLLVQVLPSVCDLFSCMKVSGDKEKWLHKDPVQVSLLFCFQGTLSTLLVPAVQLEPGVFNKVCLSFNAAQSRTKNNIENFDFLFPRRCDDDDVSSSSLSHFIAD